MKIQLFYICHTYILRIVIILSCKEILIKDIVNQLKEKTYYLQGVFFFIDHANEVKGIYLLIF